MSSDVENYKKVKAPIYCPLSGCVYHEGSERFFTQKKFLAQHIAKVHAEKKFSCGKCQKRFSLDWWRQHHEKTCGVEWKCPCGSSYTSRESLLTHGRRTQHKLPDYVLRTEKTKKKKAPLKTQDSPVIVVVQPIIQNFTCIQAFPQSTATARPILPKPIQPLIYPVPATIQTIDNSIFSSSVTQDKNENLVFTNIPPNSNTGALTNQLQFNVSPVKVTRDIITNVKESSRPAQKTMSTQTCDFQDHVPKTRVSRGAQCSKRRSKVKAVGIESIHTQTAESALNKIRKKRSRRKSVAITTETQDQYSNVDNSLWPNFQDLLLANTYGSCKESLKNTTSTQTGSSKVLCDSQTLTDDELLKFLWDDAPKIKSSDCSSFEMLPDTSNDNSLSILTGDISPNGDVSMINSFSHSSVMDVSLCNDKNKVDTAALSAPIDDSTINEAAVLSLFNETTSENKTSPAQLDIYTQTMTPSALDYNLLSHMETQTNDDFSLYCEFSDTETQTFWDDFPNIDSSPVSAEQLSIEIQTDFSSLASEMDRNPYDFMNGLGMQNVIGECSNKESCGLVNIETQTQDRFFFPQIAHTQSQTLDPQHFFE